MGNERVLKLLVSTSVAGWIAEKIGKSWFFSFTPVVGKSQLIRCCLLVVISGHFT